MTDPSLALKLLHWQQMTEQYPNLPLTWYELAGVWLDLEEFDRAIEDYTRALDLDPNYVPARYCRALALGRLGRDEDAFHEYSVVIEQDPTFVSAYNNRGLLHLSRNAFREALADFLKAGEIDPNHARSRYNQGLVRGSLEQYEEAVRAFSAALALQPAYPKALMMRAKAYVFLDRTDLARADLAKSAQVEPLSAEWHAVRAWVALKERRNAEFKEALEATVAIDPECPELPLIYGHIEALKRSARSAKEEPKEEGESERHYRREESYRENLRPGRRPPAQARARAAIAAFLLAEDGETMVQAVHEHAVLLKPGFLDALDSLCRLNPPLRAHGARFLPPLREVAAKFGGGE